MVNCSRSKNTINEIDDLHGKKIGCQAGTTGEEFLRKNLNGKNIHTFRTGQDASLALKNKLIDAVILDELPAKAIAKDNPDLKIVTGRFNTEKYAIGVKKGNRKLLESINQTIAKSKSDGSLIETFEAFMVPDGNIIYPEVPEVQSDETIIMGTNASFPPFEFTLGTDVVGVDVVLAKYIANALGKELVIIDMSFASLIEALNSDSIDFIAAGMTITDDRKELLDFSIPYYSTNQVIIVRK